jgi:hypothetical protein
MVKLYINRVLLTSWSWKCFVFLQWPLSLKIFDLKGYFVDPSNANFHTQTIESRWNRVKKQLKRKGTNVTKYIDEYLLEYCFKLKFKENIFDLFLNEIAKKYKN